LIFREQKGEEVGFWGMSGLKIDVGCWWVVMRCIVMLIFKFIAGRKPRTLILSWAGRGNQGEEGGEDED
jgi:hypothetical protein